MAKITIISIGKTKEPWLQQALAEFEKRLQPWTAIETRLAKDDSQLLQMSSAEKRVIALDPEGKQLTSEQFAVDLEEQLITSGGRLTFVIGGAEGLPQELKATKPLLSFSRMTFTHQMCRLILVEQIYRAFTIMKGKSYHK